MKFRASTAIIAALASSLAFSGASAHGLSSTGTVIKQAPMSDIQLVDRRGRNLALGIGAVIGTAIILSEAARADGHRRYRRDTYCGRLLYDCEDGIRRACYRYEDRCM
jgi:hypothetical protein